MKNKIEIRGLKKRFGSKEVLRGVDLDIPEGKTTVILGLSGGGKSTIIKHIVGLLKPDSGSIKIDGEEIAHADTLLLRKVRKKVGFLFQSGALFDSMNVYDNVAFPLREHTKLCEAAIREKVIESLKMVALKPHEVLSLFPDELSGGMRKRVGLARTIILGPEVILYDEPTSGLDPITSDQISQMIIHMKKNLGVTSILISHDIKESFKCGDYFAMLYEGRIVEFADARTFRNSDNPIVRQFLEGSSEGPIRLSA